MEGELPHIEDIASGAQKNDLPQPEETVTNNNSTSNVTGELPGNAKAEGGRPNVPAKVVSQEKVNFLCVKVCLTFL